MTVVIVNWNTRELLDDALRTLHAETKAVTFETIVIDNGSIDGSVEHVAVCYPQVRVVALPENLGFTVGNNRGFELAKGRYILLLNSDTLVLPSTVSGLVAFLDDHPGAGCVGARHLNADRTLQRSMDDFPSLIPDILTYTELLRVRRVDSWLQDRSAWWSPHDIEREVGWVNGACMMVRREVLETVGGLDEDLFIYGEELDWCYRMWESGWTVHFTPAAEVIHLGGQAMNKAADRRARLLLVGQLHFYDKHRSRWQYCTLRAVIAATAIVRTLIIAGLAVASRFGIRPTQRVWEIVTREKVWTDHRTMIRLWWSVVRLALTPTSSTGA